MTPRAGTPVARAATAADESLLHAWRNDDETRRWSRRTAVLSALEHHRWLTKTLADPGRRLWVIEEEGSPIATVRHDRIAAGRYEVNVTVAPQSRGRGCAATALASSQSALQSAEPDLRVIEAHIRTDHSASLAAFERSGYRRVGTDDDGLVLLELLV